MDKRPTLLWIVDSRSYISNHCYQRQLYETLASFFNVNIVSIRQIRLFGKWVNPKNYDYILCSMRQRTLVEHLDTLGRFLSGRKIWIYDEDPWQAFLDSSEHKGAYYKIRDSLTTHGVDIIGFLLTSRWWSEFIRSKGFRTKFVRVGMLPRFCDAGPDWKERPVSLGFQGSSKPHREKFFADIKDRFGLEVQTFGMTTYQKFMQNLHRIKIYLHSEDAPFTVEGQSISRQCLWLKEVEAASRGAFVIRNYEEESQAYEIKSIPSIRTFRNIEEIPEIVGAISGLDDLGKRKILHESVEIIRERNDWQNIVDAIYIPDYYKE